MIEGLEIVKENVKKLLHLKEKRESLEKELVAHHVEIGKGESLFCKCFSVETLALDAKVEPSIGGKAFMSLKTFLPPDTENVLNACIVY